MRLVQSPLSRSITRGVLINRALCSIRGHKFNKFSVNFRESEKRKGGGRKMEHRRGYRTGNSSRGLKNLPLATIKRMISRRAA